MIEIFSFLPFFLFASHIPYIPFSRGIVCTLPLSPQNAHSTENATVCNASVWSPFPNSEHTKSSRPLTAGTQKKLREQCKRKQRRPTQYKSKTSAPPESGGYILKRICTVRLIPRIFYFFFPSPRSVRPTRNLRSHDPAVSGFKRPVGRPHPTFHPSVTWRVHTHLRSF
uniref:Putative secreted protein n=1 Tax=Ixodes scapularis TaxID=6945 RepID=A0A4D5RC79_IXOSC